MVDILVSSIRTNIPNRILRRLPGTALPERSVARRRTTVRNPGFDMAVLYNKMVLLLFAVRKSQHGDANYLMAVSSEPGNFTNSSEDRKP